MASVFETRSRPRGIGVSTLSGSRVTTAGSTTRRRIKEDHDPDKEFRREQQLKKALGNWNLHKKLEKDSNLSYYRDRIALQKQLIEKNDLLADKLREEGEEKRRESLQTRKNERQSMIQAVREKERAIQDNGRKMKATLNEQKSPTPEHLSLVADRRVYRIAKEAPSSRVQSFDPVSPVPPTGRGTIPLSSPTPPRRCGSHPLASVTPSPFSKASSTIKSNLGDIMEELDGQIAIESVWNKLKMKKERKLAKHQYHCQRLRNNESMSPFLRQCLATYDLPFDNHIKSLWDGLRGHTGSIHHRRHSFPPKSGLSTPLHDCKDLLELMYRAAVENEHNASMMLIQKKFRQSIIDGSITHLLVDTSLHQPPHTSHREQHKDSTAVDPHIDNVLQKEEDHYISEAATGLSQSVFITSEAGKTVPSKAGRTSDIRRESKSCASHVERLPSIVEEDRGGMLMSLPSPREGCVRTFSAQSLSKHSNGPSFSQGKDSSWSARRDKTKDDRRTWHPLDVHSLLDSNTFKTQTVGAEGARGFRHGTPRQWKVPTS
jgi:hypothetical protein